MRTPTVRRPNTHLSFEDKIEVLSLWDELGNMKFKKKKGESAIEARNAWAW